MTQRLEDLVILLIPMMLTITAGSASALDFKGVDVRPFVVVQETCLRGPDFDQPFPLGKGKVDQTTSISQGGAVTASLALQLQLSPYRGGFLQGLATPEEKVAFSAAATAARLGVQTDCKALQALLACTQEGHTVVTWYGRGNSRRNSFRIVKSDSPGNESVADCPPEVEEFLTALRRLLRELKSHPDTERTSTDPSAEPG